MIGVKVVHLQYDLDPETTPMFRYVAREVPALRRDNFDMGPGPRIISLRRRLACPGSSRGGSILITPV